MELLLLCQSIFVLLVLLHLVSKLTRKPKSPPLPPGPWKLPIIGNMHNLVGDLPHRRLAHLAQKHGPLMLLKLGEVPTVIISSKEVAREIMKEHDVCISDRPIMASTDILTYGGKDLIFARYGDYWRHLRKICVLELLSQKRVQSFRSIREEEVSRLIRSIYAEMGSTVNLSRKLYALTNDVTTRAVIGDRCKDQKIFLMALDAGIEASAGFNLADYFPSSAVVGSAFGITRTLRRNQRQLDVLFDSIIREHKERRAAAARSGVTVEDEDLLDVLLSAQEGGELESPLSTDGIKGVIFDIFGAGSETSSTTMDWAMSELVKNPDVMKKAQSEVRDALRSRGKTELTEEEVSGLNYLKLVIKETMRLHSPVPFLIPRECRETFQVLGYQVPVKARVLVNTWAMGRDPAYWDEPLSFKPERFQGSPINFNGSSFEYIPFGAGRRICPGIHFGVANLELALGQLLYHFDWELHDGVEPHRLDMAESFGATVRRKNPLLLRAIPFVDSPTI